MKNFENLGAQKMVLKHLNKQIFFPALITNKYHIIFDNSQPFPDFRYTFIVMMMSMKHSQQQISAL